MEALKKLWTSAKAKYNQLMANPGVQLLLMRLRQQSTWRGFAAILAVFGIAISDDQLDLYFQAFIAGLGIMALFANEPSLPTNMSAAATRAGKDAAYEARAEEQA